MTEDGKIVAAGFSSAEIHLYDMETQRAPIVLETYHEGEITHLLFIDGGRTLASASFDGTIRLWDTVSFQHSEEFVNCSVPIESFVLTDDQEMLAVILTNFTICTRTNSDGELPPRLLQGHTASIESAIFSQPDEILASSSWDLTIRIWNIMDGACLRILRGHEECVKGLAFTHDHKTIASASLDKTVRLWDISSGDCLEVIPHASGVQLVAFSNDQQMLASLSEIQIIVTWDVCQRKFGNTLVGSTYRKFRLTSHGKYIVTDRDSLAVDIDDPPKSWEESEQPDSELYLDSNWVLSNGTERILWIPPRFRSSKFLMVRGKTVVLVGRAGEVLPLRFC
jgi:WD40 repeat protein